ncbi:hypothetical protein Cgig2_027668 [Carnegiea gigantea]|uniref:Uncharacterized protein n=1 Tax=Carnegiea gigantea TaxID=171969 RepID=A0A9Q1Q593_9CARY|nr:hypothetical protein Cgig2_027668 [Carnegiea gigantea]
MRYLGLLITTSKLSKIECRSLVEKIMGQMKLWSIRNLSFTSRAQLLNSASIFILPQEKLSMGRDCRIQMISLYTMEHSLYTKEVWRDWASIAKLVWMVALKKNIMWVKWVHGKYLKQKDWWDYQPPPDCSWYWKKVVANKEDNSGENMGMARSKQLLCQMRIQLATWGAGLQGLEQMYMGTSSDPQASIYNVDLHASKD